MVTTLTLVALTLGAPAPASPPPAPAEAEAATVSPPVAGRVISSRGHATRRHSAEAADLARGSVLYQGDEVQTGEDSALRILLQDDSVLDMAPSTHMRVEAFTYKPKEKTRLAKFTMLLGRLWARVTPSSGDDPSFSISTPNAVAGVRGTSLVVDFTNGATQVTVVNGAVHVRDALGGTQLLGPLMQSVVPPASGQVVSQNVGNAFLSQLKAQLNLKASLGNGGDGAAHRLQEAGVPAGGQPPPKAGPEQAPRGQGPAAAPPLDLDPSKNIARVRVHVQIKE
jgi:ferric-dicitrate binding protein FerR (iron transport regulator)